MEVKLHDIESIGVNIGGMSLDLAREASKLTSGWQHVDKIVMEHVIQSIYHMNWNLRDLSEGVQELSGIKPVFEQSKLEDLRYDDYEHLNNTMLTLRSKTWYLTTKMMHDNLSKVLNVLVAIDARPYRTSFINSRIFLDLHFFRRQFERATGEKLED